MNKIQQRIDALLKVHHSYRAIEAVTGVNFSQLHKLHSGKHPAASDETLRKLGLERVVTYRTIKP